jgi:hypothetical protein
MSAWKIAVAALAAGLTGLAVAADDKKPAGKKPAEAAAPDWSGFVKQSVLVGEVVKADDKELTLKVVVGPPPGRGQKPKTEDLHFALGETTLVRWKKLPPKIDAAGKRVPYTAEEMKELRSPPGAPGYAADRGDLKPGYVLELTLMRPKEVPAAKAVIQDLRVRYAVILGADPSASVTLGKEEKKKEDKKDEKKKADDKKKDEKKDK